MRSFNLIKKKNQNGFTLIELLVSIALFTVVLTVTLGAIVTIADSNKKARSLMSVTNNLNFAVDSMVRSFKAGEVEDLNFVTGIDDECFSTFETYYEPLGEDRKRKVEYCFVIDPVTDKGRITKEAEGISTELTSSDVDIDFLKFKESSYLTDQPMLTIIMHGTVKVSEKISSAFSIQTSISQRYLHY